MNFEKLQLRKQQLQQMFDQAISNANALRGAMQDCEYWIAELEKAANPPDPPSAKVIEMPAPTQMSDPEPPAQA